MKLNLSSLIGEGHQSVLADKPYLLTLLDVGLTGGRRPSYKRFKGGFNSHTSYIWGYGVMVNAAGL